MPYVIGFTSQSVVAVTNHIKLYKRCCDCRHPASKSKFIVLGVLF